MASLVHPRSEPLSDGAEAFARTFKSVLLQSRLQLALNPQRVSTTDLRREQTEASGTSSPSPDGPASQENIWVVDRLRRSLKFARLGWRAIPSSAETTP